MIREEDNLEDKMKRVGNLFEKIIDIDLLEYAAKCAKKGKANRASVKRFFANKDEKLKQLKELLESGKYHPMPYTHKVITDNACKKTRDIFVPKFYPDQIVQWALIIILKPILSKGLTSAPCASIEGRGAIYGIKKIKKWFRNDKEATKYCLVGDIRQFYPNIDQDKLMEKLSCCIKDKRMLDLLGKVIYSVSKGLPIGNTTSQWLANFYLQDFDHFVNEKLKLKHYIRYMDDMIVFSNNKRKLHQAREEIEKQLYKEKLQLKSSYQVFRVASNEGRGRAVDFLGYKFFKQYTTVRKCTYLRAVKRIWRVGKKDKLCKFDSGAILSYCARLKISDDEIMYQNKVIHMINPMQCRKTIGVIDKFLWENNLLYA